nr:reverse transcriptase domain-containing protein [Tanacetum cinerariifolium]
MQLLFWKLPRTTLSSSMVSLLLFRTSSCMDMIKKTRHIRYFNKITATLKYPNVPNTSIKLMLFPFSLEGAARIWLEKEPPRSILTWDDLVSKFINKFFPPSKTTNLHNEITRFTQRFDETFSDAWDRFKDLLRACPHHGFSKLHQLDTFYNALTPKDQDSLNSAAGGNFLDKMSSDCLSIIESKSKVRYSRDKTIAKVSTNTPTSGVSPDVAELKDMVRALLLDKKGQNQPPAPVKAVKESCVICGGAHSYYNCPATDGNIYRDNIQEFVSQASAVNYNQGNTGYHPQMISNQIRPPGFPPVANNQNVPRTNQNRFISNQNRGTNFNQGLVYQPPIFQQPAYQDPAYQASAPQTQSVSKEDFLAYVKANDAVMKNMQTQGQNMQNQLTNLTDLMTKFMNSNTASTLSSGTLPSNMIANPKSDLKAITTRSGVSYDGPSIPPPVVENEPEATKDTVFASTLKALIGNKEKLSKMARTPLNEHCSVFLLKKLPEKLGDPGKFLIPCDFPGMAECLALADLIASINLMPYSVWKKLSLPDLTPRCMTLELADRSISRSVGLAKDVYVKVGELTLRVGKEAITFILDKLREYSQEVLELSDTVSSGNPTPFYDPIISATSPTLTPFGDNDFILEEVDAFLAIEDEPISSLPQSYLDPERDIHPLEAFLKDDPSPPPSNQRNYLPEVRRELKICDDKLPVIIEKDLSVEEKAALITVLKSHKQAITWKLSDIKGINPKFCNHKILLEEDFTPAVQHQRRVNPKIHDVIKQEVIKLLDARLIYPIFDSP